MHVIKRKYEPRAAYLARVLAVMFLLMASTACDKNKYKWAYYDETYCSDKWTYSSNNEVLKENVILYFKTKGVKILDLEIFSDRPVGSNNSCSDKTGRRIKCKVHKNDLADIKVDGFYE